jgi:fluoroacetyl-CoA thioesterase
MVDLAAVTAGLTGTSQLVVGPEHTAPFVGSGRIPVLATPVMINVIEAAALNAVEHLLPAGHRVQGRTVIFAVQARDDFEVIGSGNHQRVVVSVARFDERIQRKLPDRSDLKARSGDRGACS